ncbi:MAG TPA: nucleotidyltransferase family protein [Thermoanaerobaculia bacterium]|jgi:hypothetical protein|nr:nucleotidyltransferase family protein [Thermoanaerobaculia bacterium]
MMDLTRFIASLMRAEDVAWEVADAEAFLQASNAHGATPLIAYRIREERRGIAATLAAHLETEARTHMAHEVVRQRELSQLLDQFESPAIPMLVIKGAALARTHYAHTWLRPRCDTDILIERERLEEIAEVFGRAGYAEEPSSGGELISRQRMWARIDNLGIRHCIDLHWELSNRARYARAFSFRELWSRGVAFHGPEIRMPAPGDALLIAALHLVGHHQSAPRLIWLYDIHLLHASMSIEELQAAAALARERKMVMAFDVALALSLRWFGDRRDDVIAHRAPTAIAELIDDLRCTPGIRSKLRLMGEHLFPPAAYVMEKYGVTSRAALPALYLRRAVGASTRLLRRG